MQKTIRLDGAYQLVGNALELLDHQWDTGEVISRKTQYVIGEQAVLVSIEEDGQVLRWRLHFDLDGVPGNSDPEIKRIEGWRGTTNNKAVYAHGICKIKKIRILKNGDTAVTVVK